MTDNTPDRLKEFRRQYPSEREGGRWWPIVQTTVMLAGFAVLAVLLAKSGRVAQPQSAGAKEYGLSADDLRAYAGRLVEKNLPQEAIAAYEQYLNRTEMDKPARAKICFSVAKLAGDSQQYEKALAYLYQAELLDPASDVKDEINKKIVFCLDKLGRSFDLRRELRSRTAVKRTAQDVKPGETVLAEFAGEVITDRDLDTEIEKLPASVRESFSAPARKEELLKNLVAERLLLDKAFRLELDKDPKVQEELATARDAMIVRKLIADEVKAKVTVTPEDVERFYKAEPGLFLEPATAQVRIAKADTEEAAKGLTTFSDKPVTVREGGSLPGVADSAEAAKAIFAAEPNTTLAPVNIADKWYVVRVESKTPSRTPPFEEAKGRAQQMFQAQKEREQFNALIENTLKARDVQLHVDRLKEKSSSDSSDAKNAAPSGKNGTSQGSGNPS